MTPASGMTTALDPVMRLAAGRGWPTAPETPTGTSSIERHASRFRLTIPLTRCGGSG